MRDYKKEFDERTSYIRKCVEEAHADGIIYGNSGGKDCALVGILCKAACENTVGIIMPCASKQNYGSDMDDALAVAEKFGIEQRTDDLTAVRDAEIAALSAISEKAFSPSPAAAANIAPRLRMTTLYAIGQTENRLVAGTGNRSERYMGYFTKWGDGGCDFNPVSDLLVFEIYEFLRYLGAPESIIKKAPSAGLFEGQTDEGEMGVSYAAIDRYIQTGDASEHDRAIIERMHSWSEHKRRSVSVFYEI